MNSMYCDFKKGAYFSKLKFAVLNVLQLPNGSPICMLTYIKFKEMIEFVKCATGTISTLTPVAVSFHSSVHVTIRYQLLLAITSL